MGAVAIRGLLRAAPAEDHLTWDHMTIDGRRAAFGRGGIEGPPVVFLHGWGLGSRTYKRAIKRLISRGCRVYAPALPSLGGTADLPRSQRDLDGYADWVASFMRAVGVDEPALVIGHSFGGGVGIKLAQRHPEFVNYLVLLNAVGGVAPRPPWTLMAGFVKEMWPVPQAIDTVQAAASDFLPNVVRNPVGLMRVARLAETADLRQAAADLCARGLPVLVLTSEGDSVIPNDAFETLCSAIGSEGRVVTGRHSWLLADPDSFGAAMASVVDVRVAEHRTSRAATRSEGLADLLKQTAMPGRMARALISQASPLWLMSDAAPVLAGDLALCHPKLRPAEIRAVARPIQGSALVRLTVVTGDRKGLLADSAAVLAARGLSITTASAATWPDRRLALHSFVVHGGRGWGETDWAALGESLRQLDGTGGPALVKAVHASRVRVHGGEGGDRMMVTVEARDRRGLLADICRRFAELGANIESVQARSRQGVAKDLFLLKGEFDGTALEAALTG